MSSLGICLDRISIIYYTAEKSQKALSAYFTSKQILPFAFSEQCASSHIFVDRLLFYPCVITIGLHFILCVCPPLPYQVASLAASICL